MCGTYWPHNDLEEPFHLWWHLCVRVTPESDPWLLLKVTADQTCIGHEYRNKDCISASLICGEVFQWRRSIASQVTAPSQTQCRVERGSAVQPQTFQHLCTALCLLMSSLDTAQSKTLLLQPAPLSLWHCHFCSIQDSFLFWAPPWSQELLGHCQDHSDMEPLWSGSNHHHWLQDKRQSPRNI